MHSLLKRIGAADKGVHSKPAAGYFSFLQLLDRDANSDATTAGTRSNAGTSQWAASDRFVQSL
jgi:hypothetical protein